MNTYKCIIIFPYFGKFNNYFPLFLKSCEENSNYKWLIFSDCFNGYECPSNVCVINTTMEEIKKIAEQKLGFSICMKNPHKLCEYKPAYGYIFEEYIKGYDYWGHCDCDLIFGNLDKLLTPVLNEGYDKIFAAGHLTLYKNNFNNNRRFMNTCKGKALYREAFSSDENYRFDEDFSENNVHSIFLESGASVYAEDLSMNVSICSASMCRDYYDPQQRRFVKEARRKSRYYWQDGDLFEKEWINYSVMRREYLYIHLQHRKMRVKKEVLKHNTYEILPDRFRKCEKIPDTKKEMKLYCIDFPYFYWWDVFCRRCIRKIKKIRNLLCKAN